MTPGCAGDSSTSAVADRGPWAPAIEAVLRSDPSELERSVLSDYRVSETEYAQAQALFIGCMASRGLDTAVVDGQYQTANPPGDEAAAQVVVDDALADCRAGSIDDIEWIYFGMQENPENLSLGQAIRACLKQHDLSEWDGLSDADLEAASLDPHFPTQAESAARCFEQPFGSDDLLSD